MLRLVLFAFEISSIIGSIKNVFDIFKNIGLSIKFQIFENPNEDTKGNCDIFDISRIVVHQVQL